MAAEQQPGIRSVKITGRHSCRITATEIIGGQVCRITLEPDENGRYQEVACTPIRPAREADPAGPKA